MPTIDRPFWVLLCDDCIKLLPPDVEEAKPLKLDVPPIGRRPCVCGFPLTERPDGSCRGTPVNACVAGAVQAHLVEQGQRRQALGIVRASHLPTGRA